MPRPQFFSQCFGCPRPQDSFLAVPCSLAALLAVLLTRAPRLQPSRCLHPLVVIGPVSACRGATPGRRGPGSCIRASRTWRVQFRICPSCHPGLGQAWGFGYFYSPSNAGKTGWRESFREGVRRSLLRTLGPSRLPLLSSSSGPSPHVQTLHFPFLVNPNTARGRQLSGTPARSSLVARGDGAWVPAQGSSPSGRWENRPSKT